MKLSLSADFLKVDLHLVEKILSMHGSFKIKTSDIMRVHCNLPKQTWKEIRAPGTFLPGVIKAGTYYSGRGKEYWYFTTNKTPLCVELRNNSYKRLILGVDKSVAEKLISLLGDC